MCNLFLQTNSKLTYLHHTEAVQGIRLQQEGNQHLQVGSLLQLEDTQVLQVDIQLPQEGRLELVQDILDPQHHQDTEKEIDTRLKKFWPVKIKNCKMLVIFLWKKRLFLCSIIS